jgi:hypothetical protein
MTRGTYDYGIPASIQSEYTSDDNYELAARQDVDTKFNRSGNVVFNFGKSLRSGGAYYTFSGSGGYWMPSHKFRWYGHEMAKIVTGTLNTDSMSVGANIPPFSGSQVGISGLLMTQTTTGIAELDVSVYRTTYGATAQIRVNINTGVVSYYNNVAGWSTVGTYPINNGSVNAFAFKFSFDASTHKYGKLWYGNELIADLSALSCYNGGVGTRDTTAASFTFTNETSGSLTIYLGDIIITTNELV